MHLRASLNTARDASRQAHRVSVQLYASESSSWRVILHEVQFSTQRSNFAARTFRSSQFGFVHEHVSDKDIGTPAVGTAAGPPQHENSRDDSPASVPARLT